MEMRLSAPLTKSAAASLRSGDSVLISGVVYTARDAAHKKLCELLDAGLALPFDTEGAVIYYCGPSPAPEGYPLGAAGPTTSGRMDPYAPALLRAGVLGMIGKGRRGEGVVEAMRETGAVYFAATGGAGALLSKCIKTSEVIAFPELGAEAVRRLEVEDLPAVVVIDSLGSDLYVEGPERYLRSKKE